MSDWRLAKSLATLRDQVNASAPGRDKESDGTIGDTSHAARTSDHNPNSAGVVTAIDFTHSPATGFDSYKFAERLRLNRDRRIKYVISNRKIFSSTVEPWVWRPYSGDNPHSAHVHVSAASDPGLYDDPAPWIILDPAPPPKVTPMPAPTTTDAQTEQLLDQLVTLLDQRWRTKQSATTSATLVNASPLLGVLGLVVQQWLAAVGVMGNAAGAGTTTTGTTTAVSLLGVIAAGVLNWFRPKEPAK